MIIKNIYSTNITSHRRTFHSTLHSKKTHFNSSLKGSYLAHEKNLKALSRDTIEGINNIEELGEALNLSKGRAGTVFGRIKWDLEFSGTSDTNANVKAVWEKLQETDLENL